MSTSGSYNFTLNKTQIITRALQKCDRISLTDTPESSDYSLASDVLNMMLGVWETEGIHLWKRLQGTVFPQTNQVSYQLGSVSGSDNCCAATGYVATTVSTAATLGANFVIVTSTTGLTPNMNIGIELDDGSRQWTTITTIIGTTVNLTAALTTTSKVTNTVVAYTIKINKPLKLLRATLMDLKSANSEVTLAELSYDEYFDIPKKNIAGRPCNWYYDRINNNTLPFTGTLYVFPMPQFVAPIINFTYVDSLQQMLNTTDNLDMPAEWLYPVVINLACELAEWYGKLDVTMKLQAKADRAKATLENFDSDDASLIIGRDTDNRHED